MRRNETVSESLENWFATYRPKIAKSSTVYWYESLIRHIAREIGDVKARRITQDTISGLFNATSAGRQTHVRIVVRLWLDKAHPALAGIPPIARPRKRVVCPSPDEIHRIASSARWGAPVVLTAAHSGLRFGEVIALRVADINLDASTVWVDKTYDYHRGQDTTPKTRSSTREARFASELGVQLLANF